MKTILITVFHGHIARNILRTDVLEELKKEAKVVILCPAFKRDLYEKEFGTSSVTVVAAPEIHFSRIDQFFRSFYYYFVNTNTVRIIQGEQFWITRRYFKWLYVRLLTLLIGNLRILRNFIRSLDKFFVKDTLFTSIFDTYKPDLVFIPSITSDDEGLVLRQAVSRRIKTVGMVRSWDNITVNKGNIRVYPDHLLVHGQILKDDVVRYADMDPDKITVVGMSHFDYYWNQARIPREEFFSQLGGDSSKKTIYFMPTGLSDLAQDKKTLAYLENAIRTDPRFRGAQLMLSSHPNTPKPIDYAAPETMVVALSAVFYPGGKFTDKEITKKDMELMASAIYHSDVVINYQGTTSIDAAAFDKPVINIAFDDYPNKPYLKSIRLHYDFDHYQPILKSGGVSVAHSLEEMLEIADMYLRHPEQHRENRRNMLLEQNGGYADGQASVRTASALLKMV
jgi:hypothetical protein